MQHHVNRQNLIENKFPRASQIIPRVFWKPSNDYRVRKSITPVPQIRKKFHFILSCLVSFQIFNARQRALSDIL
jgi:hypothetical protein